MSLRDVIQQNVDHHFPKKLVSIDEWKTEEGKIVEVELRAMSQKDIEEVAQGKKVKKGEDDFMFMCRALVRTMHDPGTGERIYDVGPKEVDIVARYPAGLVKRLYGDVSELSGLGETTEETGKN